MKLKNNVAVVTGAASGIGLGITQCLLNDGAAVLLVDISGTNLKECANALESHKDRLAVYEADVSSSEQVAAAAQHAVRTFGSVDTWVNNAGVWDLTTPCTQVTDALWERVLAVNLTGVFYGTREALKIMTERESGSIVNIASSAALGGARAGAAYTASKAGVVGLTKQVACEFAPNGIRANVIAPGVIPSNLSSNAAGILGMPPIGITEEEVRAGQQAAVEALVPLGRMGTAAEIGTIVSFLASSESRYMTGAVLEADGGWSAR